LVGFGRAALFDAAKAGAQRVNAPTTTTTTGFAIASTAAAATATVATALTQGVNAGAQWIGLAAWAPLSAALALPTTTAGAAFLA
jgi:hypothetical protein